MSAPDLEEILRVEDGLDAENDLEYLLGLVGDALREEDAFKDDGERARWVVAHWCQEVGYEPDLREYAVGETVPRGTVPDDREKALFHEPEADER